MRLYCGSIDDVYAYERIRRPGSGSAPSPRVTKLGGKKVSFKEKTASVACEPYQVRLDVAAPAEVTQTRSCGQTAKKMKEPSRKVGFVEILLGYHSLLQVSPSAPMARQRKQLYPTIGFVQTPRIDSE